MKVLQAIASLKALRWQFWFWIANLPPFIMAYAVLNADAFTKFSLLYLGIVTILTAALGALSSYVAETVAMKQEDDADVQDVLDKLNEDVS